MKKQGGFTLIEVLMAMAVFSFMLMIIVSGFLTIVKMQESGNVSRTTQQDTRYGIDEMVRTIRAAASIDYPTSGGAQSILCVRNISGTINEYYVDGGGHLMKTVLSACNTGVPTGGTQISSTNVAVKFFQATYIPGTPPSVQLSLGIGSTDASQFTGSGTASQCSPGVSGSQYCSLTTIATSATPRGGNQ